MITLQDFMNLFSANTNFIVFGTNKKYLARITKNDNVSFLKAIVDYVEIVSDYVTVYLK